MVRSVRRVGSWRVEGGLGDLVVEVMVDYSVNFPMRTGTVVGFGERVWGMKGRVEVAV